MRSRRGLLSFALVALVGFTGRPSARPVRDASDPALRHVGDVVSVGGVPFTGALELRDSIGRRRSFTPYLNGRRDGHALAWYPDGQLSSDTEFRNGREESVDTGWWPDGRLHFVYRFHAGLLEGEAREWFPNGILFRDFHYAAGHESGRQQMWYLGGKPRANYVVKDGRRYGLPGTKGCTGTTSTPSDSGR